MFTENTYVNFNICEGEFWYITNKGQLLQLLLSIKNLMGRYAKSLPHEVDPMRG